MNKLNNKKVVKMKKKSVDQILFFLKMRGEATSLIISEKLGISKEGARKHLNSLLEQDLVETVVKSEGVGRPTTYYKLTENGEAKFPNTHADITVQLLQSIKKLLGNNALDLLISDREKSIYAKYAKLIKEDSSIEEKLNKLSKIRTTEGYMAEWNKEEGVYFLTENHCPICVAAAECQGFCKSELENFKQLIGQEYSVERVQHIVSGAQRCTYKIEKKET